MGRLGLPSNSAALAAWQVSDDCSRARALLGMATPGHMGASGAGGLTCQWCVGLRCLPGKHSKGCLKSTWRFLSIPVWQ